MKNTRKIEKVFHFLKHELFLLSQSNFLIFSIFIKNILLLLLAGENEEKFCNVLLFRWYQEERKTIDEREENFLQTR
jgi:hypothetical protein